MQINPTASQPVSTFNLPLKSQVSAAASSDQQEDSSASSSISSGNIDKINAMVQTLMSQSNVRPEVVAGRSASDPVQQPTDAQLQSFIKGLSSSDTQ